MNTEEKFCFLDTIVFVDNLKSEKIHFVFEIVISRKDFVIHSVYSAASDLTD